MIIYWWTSSLATNLQRKARKQRRASNTLGHTQVFIADIHINVGQSRFSITRGQHLLLQGRTVLRSRVALADRDVSVMCGTILSRHCRTARDARLTKARPSSLQGYVKDGGQSMSASANPPPPYLMVPRSARPAAAGSRAPAVGGARPAGASDLRNIPTAVDSVAVRCREMCPHHRLHDRRFCSR